MKLTMTAKLSDQEAGKRWVEGADLAECILEQVRDSKYLQQATGICNI